MKASKIQNTVLSNIIGTSNLLEVCKKYKFVKCLIITTDKVYQNYKIRKHFNESSLLGGDDIYSGSKACCEIITNSYKSLFFKTKNVISRQLELVIVLEEVIGQKIE